MKIVPIDAEGEAVDVLAIEGGRDKWNLVISCSEAQHRLTLTGQKTVALHDHSPEQIKDEEAIAQLADTPGSACPCVRVKIWLSTGIYIIKIVP
jgi:hypothetical protein